MDVFHKLSGSFLHNFVGYLHTLHKKLYDGSTAAKAYARQRLAYPQARLVVATQMH